MAVDDIFGAGSTIAKVREILSAKTPNIKVATLFYRPGRNRTRIVPDHSARKTDKWIVFPHGLMDLTLDEIRQEDAHVYKLLF